MKRVQNGRSSFQDILLGHGTRVVERVKPRDKGVGKEQKHEGQHSQM